MKPGHTIISVIGGIVFAAAGAAIAVSAFQAGKIVPALIGVVFCVAGCFIMVSAGKTRDLPTDSDNRPGSGFDADGNGDGGGGDGGGGGGN